MTHAPIRACLIPLGAILLVVPACDERTAGGTTDGGEEADTGEAVDTGAEADTAGEVDTEGDGGLQLSCVEIRECMVFCTDPACERDCHDLGSAMGKAEFDAVEACYEEQGVETRAEVAALCAEPMAACLAEGTGTLSCGEIRDCTEACGDDCGQQCFDDGGAQAQVQWIQLVFCLSDHCPDFDPVCTEEAMGSGGACAEYGMACVP